MTLDRSHMCRTFIQYTASNMQQWSEAICDSPYSRTVRDNPDSSMRSRRLVVGAKVRGNRLHPSATQEPCSAPSRFRGTIGYVDIQHMDIQYV